MSGQASAYAAFLQSPNTSHLASDASINYITTTTTINDPAAILKHLQAQLKQVTKKEEKILNAIDGGNSLCLETELTLQFNNGGGAYLPSMDENLLDEKIVTFPVIHLVNFDGDQKIKQIRLSWDQGTLLKQVEAIGRTGRNWPIRDGKAQVDAIKKSLKSSGVDPISKQPLGSRDPNEVVINQHKKKDSVSATRDPHASLNLFAPRDPNEHAPADYQGPRTAPRASAKPAPRNYNELFANGESPGADVASKARSPSPTKADGVILKAGAGKHYTGNRLFDDTEQSGIARSPERKKVFGQKYEHFTFGDGEDVPQNGRPTSSGKGTKHQPTFSFEDFATPPKYQQKMRPQDEVHWGGVSVRYSASAAHQSLTGTQDDPPSPPKRPIVHAARKDADPHFNFTDDSSPNRDKPKHHHYDNEMELYKDSTQVENQAKNPSSDIVKANTGRRGDDFGAHYSMADTPAQNENVAPSKRSTRSDMAQHWQFEDAPTEKRIYKTAGDGMGSRKGGAPAWMAPEAEKKMYKTAGDGMGGRATAGGGRSWGIGDESDPEVDADVRSSARSRRTQAKAGASSGF